MNPHFHAEMSRFRADEIEKAAERYRREGIKHPRVYIRFSPSGRLVLRVRRTVPSAS